MLYLLQRLSLVCILVGFFYPNSALLQEAEFRELSLSKLSGYSISSDGLWLLPKEGNSAKVISTNNLPSQDIIHFTNKHIYQENTQTLYYLAQSSLYALDLRASETPLRVLVTKPTIDSVISDFQVSPSGDYIVYTADHEIEGRTEIYSLKLNASSAPTRLNSTLPVGGNVGAVCREGLNQTKTKIFSISPDGKNVVYQADQETDQQFNLYSASIDGLQPPIRISIPATQFTGAQCDNPNERIDLQDGWGIVWFEISPDSTRVVYSIVPEEDTIKQHLTIRSVGIDGTDDKLIYRTDNTLGLSFTNLLEFEILRNNQFVLINDSVEATTNRGLEFFSTLAVTTIDGDNITKIHTKNFGANMFISMDYWIAENSQTLVFVDGILGTSALAQESVYQHNLLTGTNSFLFSVPDNKTVVEIANSSGNSPAFSVVDNSVILVEQDINTGKNDIFTISLNDRNKRRLNSALPSNGSVDFYSSISNTNLMVYYADKKINNSFDLYVSALDNDNTPKKLNKTLTPTETVNRILIDPNGQFVIYEIDDKATRLFRSFISPITTPTPTEEICLPVVNRADKVSVICI